MAETAITTLWPWKVRELADKDSEGGVFKMLSSDVTRFLTTILIGTTVVNIGATALVTDAATAIFGEAGVCAATGVMTVAILLLTEIAPKSIAVHNPREVARFVMGMLKILGLERKSEPYITEDELKLMLRGAGLSGAIEEEQQDMIENVLEIKDTHVREVMRPLVDVVAIDASSTLVEFHNLWLTHQYSRVPAFEQRIDNIVGIAYAMDLLDYVPKGEPLESTTVGDMAHKPAYFVPGNSVGCKLRVYPVEFYLATLIQCQSGISLESFGSGRFTWQLFLMNMVEQLVYAIVTLEDVVEEIVGEIFDENDSIFGSYIFVSCYNRRDPEENWLYRNVSGGISLDVDANTSIDQLSEDLNIKMPEICEVSVLSIYSCTFNIFYRCFMGTSIRDCVRFGLVNEVFGYIPRTGESVEVVLERDNEEDDDENSEAASDRQDLKERHQIYKLEAQVRTFSNMPLY
ncbi:hypothetical protein V6N12_023908 [Hibiscus sabdariffa]|uniref:CNNM transmembrane domain-containing protein n=1 Tax=Hibiscus sabdariffa TaxID=183260 RepID=A0ABR2FZR2_9ROSI